MHLPAVQGKSDLSLLLQSWVGGFDWNKLLKGGDDRVKRFVETDSRWLSCKVEAFEGFIWSGSFGFSPKQQFCAKRDEWISWFAFGKVG